METEVLVPFSALTGQLYFASLFVKMTPTMLNYWDQLFKWITFLMHTDRFFLVLRGDNYRLFQTKQPTTYYVSPRLQYSYDYPIER